MIVLEFLSALSKRFSIGSFDVFIVNLVFAAALLIAGIILGKFVKFISRKLIEQAGIGKTAKRNFIEFFLTIIKWSIYILFFALALDILDIPQLTNWLTSILVVIPALVGATILISVGFAIAVYLRDLISETQILDSKVLGVILFYFILYIFVVFAIKTALISQDKQTVNLIIIILTAVVSAAVAYWHIKKR